MADENKTLPIKNLPELKSQKVDILSYASEPSREPIKQKIDNWRDVFVIENTLPPLTFPKIFVPESSREASPAAKQKTLDIERAMDKIFSNQEALKTLQNYVTERNSNNLKRAHEKADAVICENSEKSPRIPEVGPPPKIKIFVTDNPLISPQVTGNDSEPLTEAKTILMGPVNAQYKGIDGKFHDITTDHILVHEIFGHITSGNHNEQKAVELATKIMKDIDPNYVPRGHYLEAHYKKDSLECQLPDEVRATAYFPYQIDNIQMRNLIISGSVPPINVVKVIDQQLELCPVPEDLKILNMHVELFGDMSEPSPPRPTPPKSTSPEAQTKNSGKHCLPPR